MLQRLLIALCALVLAAAPGVAADSIVGTWTVDRAALQQTMKDLMDRQLAAMPPDRRAKVEALLAAHKDDLARSNLPLASVEFLANGKAVATDNKGTAHRNLTWKQNDAQVEVDDHDNSKVYHGHVENGRILFTLPAGKGAGMDQVTITLIPKG